MNLFLIQFIENYCYTMFRFREVPSFFNLICKYESLTILAFYTVIVDNLMLVIFYIFISVRGFII